MLSKISSGNLLLSLVEKSKIKWESQSFERSKVRDPSPRNVEVGPLSYRSLDKMADVPVSDRTRAIVRGLKVILSHHNARKEVVNDLSFQVSSYLNSCRDEEQWLARAKDLLTYPKALYLKNELPKTPDRRFEPSGALKKWMKNRLCVFRSSNTHLWYSWLQDKRASLPVSDSIVEKTYDKHFATLTKPDDGDDVVIDEIMASPTMQLACRYMSDSLEKTLLEDKDSLSLNPSKNASFESKRSQGGQQGHLIRLAGVPDFTDIRSPILSKMVWCPSFRGSQRVLETYEPEGRLEWSHLNDFEVGDEVLSATIQAVLEPMKVRVISKGNALPYYLCRKFQKAMHNSLRDLAPFRLIGRPFESCDILDIKRLSEPTWKWLSIDYSAATDNLSWKYSSRIFSDITSNLPSSVVGRLMSVLGSHDLYYPDKKGITLRGRMTRGQLMGSILSFPILCLANFGVYCHIMERLRPNWSISDIFNHVLVNGDDMLYSAPEGTFAEHRRIAGLVGLDMSIGKAYEHSEYLNINSVACQFDLRRPHSEVRRIDFLNVGLLFGQHKVQNREVAEDHHTISGVASCANEVLKGCFRRPKDVLKMYLSLHRDEIRSETLTIRTLKSRSTFQKDLFLPCSLGGLGIIRPPGFCSNTLRLPKLYATSVIDRAISENCIIDSQFPLQGFEPVEHLDVLDCPWFQRDHQPIDQIVDVRTTERMPQIWRDSIFQLFKTGLFISVPNPAHRRLDRRYSVRSLWSWEDVKLSHGVLLCKSPKTVIRFHNFRVIAHYGYG
jgi:hypothetical protein